MPLSDKAKAEIEQWLDMYHHKSGDDQYDAMQSLSDYMPELLAELDSLRDAIPEPALPTLPPVYTEVWYKIEYSLKGAADWFATGGTHDSVDYAHVAMQVAVKHSTNGQLEYRVVKVTHTEEVVV